MLLKSKKDFYEIKKIEDIKKTPSNSTILYNFDIELIKYSYKNHLDFAIFIKNIKEAIIANYFEASFVIVDKKRAKEIQEIANEYLFDTKILVKIRFDWEIEKFAKLGIDGVVLDNPPF